MACAIIIPDFNALCSDAGLSISYWLADGRKYTYNSPPFSMKRNIFCLPLLWSRSIFAITFDCLFLR